MKLKSGMKRRKRNPEKTQRNRELKKWKLRALDRANRQCEWCGKEGPGLNVHHIISRHNKETFTEDINSLVLCAKCHKFSRGIAAHENPITTALWLEYNRPNDWHLLKEYTKALISARGEKLRGVI